MQAGPDITVASGSGSRYGAMGMRGHGDAGWLTVKVRNMGEFADDKMLRNNSGYVKINLHRIVYVDTTICT